MMMRFNGIGTTLLGVGPQDNDGVADATVWFTFLWLPIIPLQRYKVKFLGSKRERVTFNLLEKESLVASEVLKTYVLGLVAVPLITLGPIVIAIREVWDMLGFPESIHIPFGIAAIVWSGISILAIQTHLDRKCYRPEKKQGAWMTNEMNGIPEKRMEINKSEIKETEVFKTGFCRGFFIFALCLVGGGVWFFCDAFFGHHTLAISGWPLPQWVYYAFAFLLALFGVAFMKSSFKMVLCARCGRILDYCEALFSVQYESEIVSIIESLDATKLQYIPKYNNKGIAVRIAIDYCEECNYGYFISAHRLSDNKTRTPIVKPRIVDYDSIKGFLPYFCKRSRIDSIEMR